ncbi:lipid A deacylase LpxR family protein [Desulfovibrio litoralis]|nr:lipid A deacylase LpxR family protein [Desulfovibrio litoralis]
MAFNSVANAQETNFSHNTLAYNNENSSFSEDAKKLDAYAEKDKNQADSEQDKQNTEDTIVIPKGSLTIYFENDLFYNTDKYYTNAVQMRFVSPPLASFADNNILPDFCDELLNKIQKLQDEDNIQYNVSIGMGQSIYTPKDTYTTLLQKDDRPYAGYLYGFLALHAKQETQMDTFELTGGIVGPSALGEQSQNEVHRIRGFETANGWEHQLRDEPAFMFSWSRNYRLNKDSAWSGWNWDILPYHTMSVGNIFTQATIGSEFRFGWNLPSSFGTSLIRPGSSVDAPTPRSKKSVEEQQYGYYLFAGAEGRAVAHNIFLDGNTWKDSHSIEKNNFVGELNGGVAVTINEVRISYTHVFTTREFKGQPRPQNYGSITVMMPF